MQFITLRLADAMPLAVLHQWEKELDAETDELRQRELYRRVEKYLDSGYGECHLSDPVIASMVEKSLKYNDGRTYKLIAWTIMPNHIHYMIRPHGDVSLSDIMQSFKSYTAHKANKMLGRRGSFWQVDYFDRYIRNYDHFIATLDYINLNPVKAGLCKSKKDWPYGSARL